MLNNLKNALQKTGYIAFIRGQELFCGEGLPDARIDLFCRVKQGEKELIVMWMNAQVQQEERFPDIAGASGFIASKWLLE